MKLFVFGIDGASFEIIQGLINQGHLKNFKHVLEKGSYANLITLPPKTIPMWPCIFMGVSATDLGYFDFYRNGTLFLSDQMKGKTIFDVLSQEKHLVLNLPGSYPSWNINKYMIAGEFAPSLDTYPSSLKKNPIFNGYILHEKPKNIASGLQAFTKRCEVVDHFLKQEDLDSCLFASTFSEAAINHLPNLAVDGKEYLQAYEKIDAYLGKLIKNSDINNIMLMSDHGTHRYTKVFNIKRYLEKKGFYKQSWKKHKSHLNNITNKLRISKTIKKVKMYSAHIAINYLYARDILNSLRAMRKKQPLKKFYIFGGSNCGALYEADVKKCSQIKEMLEKEPFVKKVEYTKELYGFRPKDAPHLMIELEKNMAFSIHDTLYDLANIDKLGHSKYGIFIAYGKDFKNLGRIKDVSYLDFAPTILYLFGYDKAPWMKGSPVKEIFKTQHISLKKAVPDKLSTVADKIKI